MGLETWIHQRPRLIATVAVLLVLATFGGLAVWFLDSVEPDINYTTDDQLLALSRSRLTLVGTELEGLPQIRGVDREKASVRSCTTESGQLFQPAVVLEWRPVDRSGSAARDEIAAALRESGWEGDTKADTFGNFGLTKAYENWTAVATLSGPYEGFPGFIEVGVRDLEPCERVPD